jgi:AcrR family transcriptional regulator
VVREIEPDFQGTRVSQTHPRRAPAPEERQRDADRSRQALLEAALEEFSAKGFAGARVADIAERAGVNKQLINYYFEGKEGLYRQLQRQWLDRDDHSADADLGLGDLADRYLHQALADPRLMRLLLWRGLTDPAEQPPDESADSHDLTSIRARQRRGELADDLDPACVRLVLMGAVIAPIAMPHEVRKIVRSDPHSPEFEHRYGQQLRRIVHHLAVTPPADAGNADGRPRS